jgi:hypothetical protein
VAVGGRVRRGQQPVGRDQRREPLRLPHLDHPARHAELVLHGDALLEESDVLGPVEQEEVADLVEVDLLPELLPEGLERPQAAQAELDVHHVGELRPHATGRLARRPGTELVLLDQRHVAGRRTLPGGTPRSAR